MEQEVRLVDANKLKNHYAWWENGTAEMTLAEAKRNFDVIIDVQPTVDAEPVRHGRWEVVDEAEPRRYGCSYCKRLSYDTTKYCSYCGAKMDEVEDAKEE